MGMTYVVHIVAGGLGLLSGYLALFAVKGATVHRRSGLVFVYAMLAVSLGGLSIAIVRDVAPAINIPAGVLTAYLVVTALATVRPRWAGDRPLTITSMLVAGGVAVASLVFAYQAIANGGMRDGMPPFPFFMFGGIALLGALGDARVVKAGALAGPRRLARHLWRMSTALFIAALSFFIGQADVIPKAIRIRPLLALPVVLVLVMMVYWLWRVRLRRSLRGIIVARIADAPRAVPSRS